MQKWVRFYMKGLKEINSAVLASHFRRVLGTLSKKNKTKNGKDTICVKDMW